MTQHLSMQVRWHGATIEHRVCRLREGMWVGDRSDAVVSFSGIALKVSRDRSGWLLGGHRLQPGVVRRLVQGEVEVEVALVAKGWSGAVIRDLPDLAPLVVVAAMTVGGLWLESASHWLQVDPVAVQAQALLWGTSAPVEAAPAPQTRPALRWRPPVELAPTDGSQGGPG